MLPGDKLASIRLGNRRAGHLPGARWNQRRCAGDRSNQLFTARQLPVAEGLFACGIGDFAIGDGERCGINAPLFGCQFDQRLAGRGGHGAQARAHLRRGLAAEGSRVIGDEVGVSHDHGDGVEWQHQLFGHRLRQRCADILADLNLAGKYGDFAVGVDVQPCGDCGGYLLATAETAAGLLRECSLAGETDQQASAEELEEVAAVELEAMQRVDWIERGEFNGIDGKSTHRAPPFAMECAACRTASTMRG